MRFEPTYKELKLSQAFFPVIIEYSFEPTYKELKHLMQSGFSGSGLSF